MALVRFQIRGDTAAQWTSVNPVLAARELAAETDTRRFKVGDGVTAWNALPYMGTIGPEGPQGPAGPAGTTDHAALLNLSGDHHAQYLRADGARQLAGNLAVAAGATIDGRDISADGAALDAHVGSGGSAHAAATTSAPGFLSVADKVRVDALWGAPVALADGATIALNAALGCTFRVTLGGNRALAAPTNPTDGQSITLEVAQDGAGGRTLTLASGTGGFAFSTDAPSGAWQLSSAPNALDVATFKYRAAAQRWLVLGLMRGF